MEWIISIILFIILIILGFSKYKTNKSLKEILKDRENNFKEFCNNHIKELEELEKERQEKLEKEFKEKENNIRYNLNLLNKDLDNKKNQLKFEEEKLQDKIRLGERVVDSELSKYRAEKIFSIDSELANQKKAADYDYINYYNECATKKNQLDNEINEIKIQLEDFRSKRAAVNEAIRLEEENRNNIDSHRIVLSTNDKEDIAFLVSIVDNIKHKEILNKLIWSEYLQKPFNNMIKNLFGNNIPNNVIYCIENINTGKKYIGKTSAEVSKRWTEHIKTSLNIGTVKKSKIHDALYCHWDEFIFSVIEITEKEKISEREKYYISFFETDLYGYNLKSGG